MNPLRKYKQATREHINRLMAELEAMRQRAEAAESRAEATERAVRNLVIEKDRWKRQAKEQQARLASL